ncbi:hypothetical protein FO519_001538 [Halicephalobus sp. NKZ332]|nr:hypothetical protein FO519_001538 [Halicephalobus sp. NKZ332]
MSIVNLTTTALAAPLTDLTGSELVEMGLCIVTELFCILLMIILFRTYPFHTHLWMFLVNLVVIIMIYTALRFTIILFAFYRFNADWERVTQWLGYVRYIAVFTESADIFCIVCERSLAAKFTKKYEKLKCYAIPVLCIGLCWIAMSLLVVYSMHFGFLPYAVVLCIVFGLSVTSAVMKENIKSSKFLLPLISFLTLTSCANIVLLMLTTYFKNSFISIRVFDFVLSVRSFIVPIVIAKGHCAFRNQLLMLITTASNLVSSTDTGEMANSRARSGQVYAIAKTALDMHFESLRNAWEMAEAHRSANRRLN